MEKTIKKVSETSVYTLPGLGFDARIFGKIDFGQYRVTHLNWLEPEPAERLSDYSKRMSADIENSGGSVILVGHSFGGMVAQEIAQVVDIQKIILVSSIEHREEMPWHFRAIAPWRLHRFFSKKLILATFGFWAKRHGYRTAEEQHLFKSMIERQTDGYLKWALKSLSEWQPPGATNAKIAHIHGENDKTFPLRLLRQPYRTVEGGSHFMVFSQAEKVGRMIREELNSESLLD